VVEASAAFCRKQESRDDRPAGKRLISLLKNTAIGSLVVCLFLLIVGAKWATFDRYGSPMPDWDQWDAEGYYLLIPWLDQNQFVEHLFRPHNEHRVVLTKLQNLALAVMNGQWDSRLEAVTNAMLHALLGAAFWVFARRWTAAVWHAPLFLLIAALFGLPLAWQNVLGGFHSQQYWLLGLSLAALVTLPFARTGTSRWWIGLIAAILAMGSMGSGFLAAAVVLVVVGWRLVRRDTVLRSVWPTIILCLGLVAIGLLTRVEVDYHQQLKAKTLHDFVFSSLRSMEWPLRDRDWAGLILWLPWTLVLWRVLRRPLSEFNDRAAPSIAALGGWVLVQIVATAYARGAGADYPASRYMDTLVFGTVVNGIALAWLLSRRPGTPPSSVGRRLPLYGLGVAWIVLFSLGLYDTAARNFRHELPDAKKYYIKAEGHMRRYLATNSPTQLAYPEIPYPSAQGLIDCLAHPGLRSLMPVPIRSPFPIRPANADSGFAENNAITASSESPPQVGLSPGTPPLDASVSWGSFAAESETTPVGEPREWRSAPIDPPKFGWLKFETAGQVGHRSGGVSLTLEDAQTGRTLARIAPTRMPDDTWRAAYVRTPSEPFVIVATDASATQWIAFSPPIAMGAGSYWAWRVTKHGKLILYFAAGLSLILTVSLVFSWSRRQLAAGIRQPIIGPVQDEAA